MATIIIPIRMPTIRTAAVDEKELMALFDRYLMVDWSAASKPTTGKDSVWACLSERDGDAIRLNEAINFPTRSAFMDWFARQADEAIRTGARLLAGFDFAFAYPAGAAERMAGSPDALDLWRVIGESLEDGDDNANNRFELAGRINRQAFADGHVFWGLPSNQTIDGLTHRKPPARSDNLGRKRLAEARAKGAQSVWQLYYNGSVGSQSLTGIARLQAFRTAGHRAEHVAVWPFETGFSPFAPKAVTIAEIYPSLFKDKLKADRIKDRAQVQLLAEMFADFDSDERLQILLGRPDDVSEAEADLIRREEGWILGLGADRLADRVRPVPDSLDYIRAPQAIYDQSFATIRAEADLSRFPKGMDDLVIRLIHACGMVDLARDVAFSPEAFRRGAEALAAGAPVICDVEMVRHGIIRKLLPKDNDVLCLLNDPATAPHARQIGNTRSAAQIDRLGKRIAGAVVAIGNAPTALFRLLESVAAGNGRPAVVLGFPVGFVGAAESKQALAENDLGLDYITVSGRRGGSAMASAAVNALAGGLGTNV